MRFEKRFEFNIEPRTLELMDEAYPLLAQISGERLRHEFDLILEEENPSLMFERFHELGLLSAIHPELKWNNEINENLKNILYDDIKPEWNLPNSFGQLPLNKALAYLVWLGRCTLDTTEEIAKRLKFPKAFVSHLRKLSELWQEINTLPDMPISNLVSKFDETPITSLYVFYYSCNSDVIKHLIETYMNKWQFIKPEIDGKFLFENNIKPGPIYKLILSSLRNAWLDNKISTVEEEKEFFKYLINKYNK